MPQDLNIPTMGWEPRDYQSDLWSYRENGGKRAVAIWHRRAGKDLVAINRIAVESMQRIGLYWHCFPTYAQGRKIAWDGATKTGQRFLSAFPDELIAHKRDQEMKIELKNGSIYQVVGTDNVDRLVGANPIGVVFSEYSLSDPQAWELIRPMLSENEGWAIFIYTPRGKNHGYKLLEMARKRPHWFCQVLTVADTKAIPLKTIEEEKLDGMPDELVQQEYYCSFEAPLVGSYYAKEMAEALRQPDPTTPSRIGKVPYDPNLKVHTAWDIGIGDSTAILFYQVYGNEIRLIDYYEASGEGLAHYVKILGDRPWPYGEHNAPHDIEARELGTGKSRYEVALDMGLRFRITKKLSFDDGINAVRAILPRCWFDAGKCERAIEGLRQYRKEWDEKRKVYTDRPVHDWSSHICDAMRILAVSFRDKPKNIMAPQRRAVTDESEVGYFQPQFAETEDLRGNYERNIWQSQGT